MSPRSSSCLPRIGSYNQYIKPDDSRVFSFSRCSNNFELLLVSWCNGNKNEMVLMDTMAFHKAACLIATWKALFNVGQKSFGVRPRGELQGLTVLGLLETEMSAERVEHL